MRLPNGYGGVVKLSGNRRRPYAARITTGWHINDITGKRIQHYQILGYAPTQSEALQILARYNNYPIDGETLKLTFREIYLRWSEEKFPTISHSNIKGYRAAFATCESIADIPFHNLRLNDLQSVIDHCGKNYPTLKKNPRTFQPALRICHETRDCSKGLLLLCKHLKIQRPESK